MKRILTVIAGGVTAVVFSTTAFAQGGSSNNDALMLLLDQFQDLRGEVQALRGMVEEQAYEIRRLQQDSLDRYSDLDSRISTLYQDMDAAGGSTPAVSASGNTPPAISGNTAANNAAVNPSSLPASSPSVSMPVGAAAASSPASGVSGAVAGGAVIGSSAPAVQTSMLTEQQLYELALDSLLQQEEYQLSIQQFDQYLEQYPNGRFVTNAYYWQGQAYVNLSMFAEARDVFEIILQQYPDGRKIEDAMYSLGTVYHRLGDNARARQLLQDVRTRFPNTSAANLADIYMRSLN